MKSGVTPFDRAIDDALEEYGDDFNFAITRKSHGMSFLDRLLMGFITTLDNGEVRKSSRKQRLADALDALTGMRPPDRSDARDDWDELAIMANWYASDRAAGTNNPRSMRDLARQICDIRGLEYDQHVDRLRKKFATHKSELIEEISDISIEVEIIHRQAMAEIEHILNKLGIPFFAYR